METPWLDLDRLDPRELVETRQQMHWAAQVAAAPGATLAEARADFSHLSLAPDADRQAFHGPTIPGKRPWSAALRLSPARIELRGAKGETIELLELDGRTLDEARGWLQAAAERWTSEPLARDLALPEQRPGEHALDEGAAFELPARPSAVLGAWYSATLELLEQVGTREPGASPVRLWPHHFDQAVLVDLARESGMPDDASVGVGFSPGDDGHSAPYLYVTPWPHPEPHDLPTLPAGGQWNTKDWVGAVLSSEALLAMPPAERAAQAAEFVATGVASARRLLAR